MIDQDDIESSSEFIKEGNDEEIFYPIVEN